MRFGLLIALGLVFAAALGLAAHLIARDTVALPVGQIEAGERLAPVRTETTAARPRKRPRKRAAASARAGRVGTPKREDTGLRGRGGLDEAEVDSHGDRSGSNSGSSNSGSGSSGSGSGHGRGSDD